MSAVIKNAIKTNLDELVSANVLAGCSSSDLKKDPLDFDAPAFPWAYLSPPAMESEVLDNRSLLRTYTYDIMILWKAENIASTTEVEADLEAIVSKFDNDPTLSGTALGGVLPVSSAPQPFQHQRGQLIMAIVQIQAKQHVMLTF